MQFKTYHAYTMAEALAAVKRDLGGDAVILRTRTFRRGGILGFGRKTVVEVVAMPGDAAQLQRHRQFKQSDRAQHKTTPRAATKAYQRVTAKRESSDEPANDVHDPDRADGPTMGRSNVTRQSQRELQPNESDQPAPSLQQTQSKQVDEPPTHKPAPTAGEAEPSTPIASGSEPAPSTVEPKIQDQTQSEWKNPRRFILQPADMVSPPVSAGADGQPGAALTGTSDVSKSTTPAPARAPAEIMTSAHSIHAQASLQDGVPQSFMTREMHDELSAIRTMVGHVLQRQTIATGGKRTPTMPQQLFDMYLQLIGQDVSEELADRVVNDVREELSTNDLENEQRLREAIMRHLADYIPVAEQPVAASSPDGRPLTIALIGPTGVGKTTTLAKLAASFKLRHQQKVGLITADTYRIAAVDQLRTYANIIGLPLEVVLKPSEMTRAMHALGDCDVILIDSAGRSQNDANRLAELKQFIEAAEPHEVHLVLSGTASERVLLREAEAFSDVGVDKIVLTKLDEAVSFGVLVNVVRQVGKQLSFVTTGQEVPDHIEVGRAERLAELVLGNEVCST